MDRYLIEFRLDDMTESRQVECSHMSYNGGHAVFYDKNSRVIATAANPYLVKRIAENV